MAVATGFALLVGVVGVVGAGPGPLAGTARAEDVAPPSAQSAPLPVENLDPPPPVEEPIEEPAWIDEPQAATVSAGSADVAVPATGFARAGGLPLWVAAAAAPGLGGSRPARVSVQVLDHSLAARLGTTGIAFRVRRADAGTASGPVSVRVDYAALRHVHGGNLARRLRLVAVPACALAAPARARCAAGGVAQANDPDAGTLTATVTAEPAQSAGGTVYAVTSTASGGGSYAATPVSSSSDWTVGANAGAFAYTYPLALPPAPAGTAVPDLDLHYSSQAVDGLSDATNNQAGWAGLGWSLNPGFVERRTISCGAAGYDTGGHDGDLCFPRHDEFVLVMGEWSGELVQDTADPTLYRLRDDPGWRVTRLAGRPNGAQSGTAWRLTSPDGTDYYFGWGVQGPSDSGPATDSVLTVPIRAGTPDQPCAASGYCPEAGWRWQLDRVVDANGNTATLFWTKEGNRYGADALPYDRAGHLSRVEYGTNLASGRPAPVRVTFGVTERCTGDPCATYPDTPTDLRCASTTSCTEAEPSFFTTKKLSSVTTQVYAGADAGGDPVYKTVDDYALSYAFPVTGDGTDPALFLAGVKRTGRFFADASLAKVQFRSRLLNNRADSVSEQFPRVEQVLNELGGQLDVAYGQARPCTSAYIVDHGGHWDTNDRDCYPAYGYGPGSDVQGWGTYNKYLVTDVVQRSVYQKDVRTHYAYYGGAAWHHDDDLVTPDGAVSWNDWRGYQHVRVSVGDTEGSKQHTHYWYYRGISGDLRTDGTRPAVSVVDADGTSYDDGRVLAGQLLDERDDTGGDGDEISRTRYTYWTSQTADGFGWHDATLVRQRSSVTREDLDGGAYRYRTVTTTYDADGLPVAVDDDGGPGNPGRCTRTWYAKNTAAWLLATPYRAEQVSCADGTVLARTEAYYDGHTSLTAAPAQGNPTEVVRYADADTTSVSTAGYDAYGRVVTEKTPWRYANGKAATTTTYAPAEGYPDTVTVTAWSGNDTSQTTTTDLWAAWGAPSRVTDPNGNVRRYTYDALGRTREVYDYGNASTDPSARYTYGLSQSGVSVVETEELQGRTPTASYRHGWSYYDGFARLRQTQVHSAYEDGDDTRNRVVVWNRIDDRAQVESVTAPVWATGDPGSGLAARPPDANIPSQTAYDHDALGRELSETLVAAGAPQWSTATAHHGDHDVVTPPSGGTVEHWQDMLGRLVSIVEHTGTHPVTTSYGHDARGGLTSITVGGITDATYGYDWLGRRVHAADADAGTTDTTFDPDGNALVVSHTVGAASDAVTTAYDAFGRPTARRRGSDASGPLLVEWTYDSAAVANGNGRPAEAVRHDPTFGPLTVRTTGYDARGEPTGVTYALPAEVTGTAKDFTYRYAYDEAGHQTGITYPATAALAAETVTTSYTVLGTVQRLVGADTYVSNTDYTPTGQLAARDLPIQGGRVHREYTWDGATGRLTGAVTQTQTVDGSAVTATADIERDAFGYDPTGNLTALASTYGPGSTGQRQCFRYDGVRRLTRAFTTGYGSFCNDPATLPNPMGLNPYDLAYSYDDTGNVTRVVDAVAGRQDAYGYSSAGYAGPHAVTSVAHTVGSAAAGTDAYGYDAYGAMASRTVAGVSATLGWDAEHRLASVTSGGAVTRFGYEADGARLLRRAPDGTTTLFLPGVEVRLSAAGAEVSATRYYDAAGVTVAMRTGAGLTALLGDRQSSTSVAVARDTGAVAVRRYLPYGAPRDDVELGTERGFLGHVEDPTGLVELANRYYDPALGRFVSPDPLGDLADPQSLNPYAYAADNPTTAADPSGLIPNWGMQIDGGGYLWQVNKRYGGSTPTGLVSGILNVDDAAHGIYTADRAHDTTPEFRGTDDAGRTTFGTQDPEIPAGGCNLLCRGIGVAFTFTAPGRAAYAVSRVIDCATGVGSCRRLPLDLAPLPRLGGLRGSGTVRAAAEDADPLKSLGEVLGRLPKGKNRRFRTVESEAALRAVYEQLARGGRPVEVEGYKGVWVERGDGIRVGWRDESFSGGSAIDIKVPGRAPYKVHIDE